MSDRVEEKLAVAKLAFIIPCGLLAVSIASILIRWCEAPALAIAAYRLLIAAISLILLNARKFVRLWSGLTHQDLKWGVVSGIFLAIHFATWIRSLELTSVASSVVLVSTAPFFVALGSRIFLRAKIASLLVTGLLIAFIGMLLVARSDIFSSQNTLAGDFFALLGAMAMAGYMLCGQYLRAKLDTLSYISVVYSVAALFLWLTVLGARVPMLGYSGKTYLLFVLIALIPQLIGHSSFNWSLKYLSAPLLSTILLGEPVLASLLALVLLHEQPTGMQVIGSVFILIGVSFAIWSEK